MTLVDPTYASGPLTAIRFGRLSTSQSCRCRACGHEIASFFDVPDSCPTCHDGDPWERAEWRPFGAGGASAPRA